VYVCLQGGLREVLARQRVALEGARLLVLNASHALDRCVAQLISRIRYAGIIFDELLAQMPGLLWPDGAHTLFCLCSNWYVRAVSNSDGDVQRCCCCC
jgi:hypothetical protein